MAEPYARPDRVLSSSSLANSESGSGSSKSLKTISQPSSNKNLTNNFAIFSILELALLDARASAIQKSLLSLKLDSHPAFENPLDNYLFSER